MLAGRSVVTTYGLGRGFCAAIIIHRSSAAFRSLLIGITLPDYPSMLSSAGEQHRPSNSRRLSQWTTGARGSPQRLCELQRLVRPMRVSAAISFCAQAISPKNSWPGTDPTCRRPVNTPERPPFIALFWAFPPLTRGSAATRSPLYLCRAARLRDRAFSDPYVRPRALSVGEHDRRKV